MVLVRAFDCRLARLAATIGSGDKQGGNISPPAGRVRLKTPAGRGLTLLLSGGGPNRQPLEGFLG